MVSTNKTSQITQKGAPRAAQWSKALSPGSVTAGRDRETHGAVNNWPSIVRVRGGFGRQGCDSCGGPGAVHADTVARCTVFPPTPCWGWLPDQVGVVSRSSAAWLGCVFGGRTALDLRLSRVCTGVAAIRQDCNYHLDTTKLWGRNTKRHGSLAD